MVEEPKSKFFKDNSNSAGLQLKQVIAGGFSGVFTRFSSQPFDVLKVRFQLQIEPIGYKSKTSSKYRSIFQAVKLIIREESVFGLWKGHNPAQLLSLSYGITQFWTYERLTVIFKNNSTLKTKPNLSNFISGSCSGAIATAVGMPFDVIRTRLIAQDHKKGYKSATQAFRDILKYEGVPGLYRGISTAILQIAPQMGSNFMIYQFCSTLVAKKIGLEQRNALSAWILLIIGAGSGMISKAFVYPFDLIKRRLQIQGFTHNRQSYGRVFVCYGVLSCIKLTLQREGFGGLFKGITPTILKSAFTTSLYFSTYDKTLKFLTDNF